MTKKQKRHFKTHVRKIRNALRLYIDCAPPVPHESFSKLKTEREHILYFAEYLRCYAHEVSTPQPSNRATVNAAREFLENFVSITPAKRSELLKNETFLRVVKPFTVMHYTPTPEEYDTLYSVVPEIDCAN